MVNALLVLYDLLGNNFFLAIVVFTIAIRVVTLPLQWRQQKTSMRMQAIQPQIQAIQKKYRDNPQKMQEEFKKIGYNPAETLSGCLPLLIQMPILIGLYRAIILILGGTPQALFELTGRVYSGINLADLLPVANRFLWLNLGQPDPYLVLPILVLVTMFAQQKVMTPPPNPNQAKTQQPDQMASMNRSMQITMPLMFGFISLSFASGLSLYFILSNVIGIAQGFLTRRSVLTPAASPSLAYEPVVIEAESEPRPLKSLKVARPVSNNHYNRPIQRPVSKRKRRSAGR